MKHLLNGLFLTLLLILSNQLEAQNWTIEYSQDEFGDKTDTPGFIYNIGKGTFLNSNDDGDLEVLISITDFNYKLYFFENGKNATTADIGGYVTELRIKDDVGKIYSLDIVKVPDGTASAGEEYNKMISLLKKNKVLKLYYEVEDDYSGDITKYRFKINCIGFSSKYNKAF